MEILPVHSGMALGPCTLGKLIGQGSGGVVYSALHATLPNPVAVKVLFPPAALSAKERAGLLSHYRRGSERAATLRHPHILPLLDYGEQDGLAYQILPFRSDGSLYEWVQRTGPLPPEKALSFLEQMAGALSYAQAEGSIHGAVNPANLLLADTETVQLADFGLRTVLPPPGKRTSKQEHLALSLWDAYLSPEQLLGGKANPQSDVYASGAVLYYLLTGLPPYEGTSAGEILMQHLQTAGTTYEVALATIPLECAGVVKRALSKLPEKRYTSMEEMVLAFRAALATGLTTREERDREATSPWRETLPPSSNGLGEQRSEIFRLEAVPQTEREFFPGERQGGEEQGQHASTPPSRADGELGEKTPPREGSEARVLGEATPVAVATTSRGRAYLPSSETSRLGALLLAVHSAGGSLNAGRMRKWGDYRWALVCTTLLLLSALLLFAVLRGGLLLRSGRGSGALPARDVHTRTFLMATQGQPGSSVPFTTKGRSSFTNGSYQLVSTAPSPTLAFLLSALGGTTTTTSISVKEIAGDDTREETAFGLLLHCSSPTEGSLYLACYSFEISGHGDYQFWKYDARSYESRMSGQQRCWTLLWHRQVGREFHPGHGMLNRLTVIERGGAFTLQVNGKGVGGVVDTFLPSGILGMIVGHIGTEVAFSSLVVTTGEA